MSKKILKIAGIAAAAVVGVVLLYFIYLLLGFIRIKDHQPLESKEGQYAGSVVYGETYTVVTQNIGFGAYTSDFTFFMDGGEESRAESAESVQNVTQALADEAEGLEPEFILFQEVDTDSTRSHHIDQKAILEERFADFDAVFGVNYHSPYLLYPFSEPIGASNSGLLTLSKHTILEANRRSLPISKGLDKFLDLDRCYTVTRIAAEEGKELVLYNVHLSAYGGSEELRNAQVQMLVEDMKAEYDKGNYCIAGGDFNHDFTGDSTVMFNGATAEFGWAQPFPAELLPEGITRCLDDSAPTCRNCDVPYEPGNFTIIVDGFLVSENIEVQRVQNMDACFMYSDHNPVLLEFALAE